MKLADWGKIPPKEWCHDPNLRDNDGRTVAMYFARMGIIPPKEWYHNPRL